jgi:glutathione S-transferase
MSRVLYTSGFSTFARKAALALELKGLRYDAVDALQRDLRSELEQVNPRREVPVLLDDGLVIVNSSDILQYLDWRYPEPTLYPAAIEQRVTARALERLADQRLDPIVVNCSYWHWAERLDEPPPGLLAAGQHDLEVVLLRLQAELAQRPQPWPFGAPGVIECAWFPNLIAAQPLGLRIDASRFSLVLGWLQAMRAHPVFAADRKRTAAFLKTLAHGNHERRRLFWSGERLEWLLARGFHDWFVAEIRADRVAFPD